jgi:hypothetical protein
LRSSAEIITHLEDCLDGFSYYPADTSFLRGYEAALFVWKFMIKSGSINPSTLVEEQLIGLCPKATEDYRSGFLTALVDVNDDFSPRH